jgi:hypothetical protein
MRSLSIVLAALVIAGSAAAQRRARIGPTASIIALDDESGGSKSFPAFGGSFAFLSGDDGELGVAVSRYGDLSSGSCARRMTFAGVESNYYPVGPKGIAPFASTTFGLARVLDQNPELLPLGCASGAATTSEIGLGFGLGVRVAVGSQAVAMLEGRFFQVPNSAIQALEGRANLSLAFGKPRQTQLLNGTLGPSVGLILPLSGALKGRGPAVGVRFRRDTKKPGSVAGLQIDYAPLEVTANCSGACRPYAILFAPGFEPSLRPAWGRLYFDLGLLLAGFPQRTADRGLAQGAHAGVGADIATGRFPMWNLNARALWLQRSTSTDRNAFLLQFGVSVSPPIESR